MRTPEERTQCNRCGACCEDVQLRHSPEKLAEYAKNNGPETEVGMVARMLIWVNQYHTNFKGNKWNVHHYRCKNFSRDENGLGVCGIHETRPLMCSQYPYYFGRVGFPPTPVNEEEKLHIIASWPYPAQYAGCSYNKDDEGPGTLSCEDLQYKPNRKAE